MALKTALLLFAVFLQAPFRVTNVHRPTPVSSNCTTAPWLPEEPQVYLLLHLYWSSICSGKFVTYFFNKSKCAASYVTLLIQKYVNKKHVLIENWPKLCGFTIIPFQNISENPWEHFSISVSEFLYIVLCPSIQCINGRATHAGL